MSSIIRTGAQESPRSSVLIQKPYEIIKNHGRMVDKAYGLHAASENFRKKDFSFSHTFDVTVDMPEDFEPRHCIVGYTGYIDLYPNSDTYYHLTGPCTSFSPDYCYASFYDYDVLGNTTRMTRTNRYRDFENSPSRGGGYGTDSFIIHVPVFTYDKNSKQYSAAITIDFNFSRTVRPDYAMAVHIYLKRLILIE